MEVMECLPVKERTVSVDQQVGYRVRLSVSGILEESMGDVSKPHSNLYTGACAATESSFSIPNANSGALICVSGEHPGCIRRASSAGQIRVLQMHFAVLRRYNRTNNAVARFVFWFCGITRCVVLFVSCADIRFSCRAGRCCCGG